MFSLCYYYVGLFKLYWMEGKYCFYVQGALKTSNFDVELCLSPRWIGGDIGSTDATKTCHTLNAYIFETNNLKVINNTSLDSL
jgi:hypothetical protein